METILTSRLYIRHCVHVNTFKRLPPLGWISILFVHLFVPLGKCDKFIWEVHYTMGKGLQYKENNDRVGKVHQHI